MTDSPADNDDSPSSEGSSDAPALDDAPTADNGSAPGAEADAGSDDRYGRAESGRGLSPALVATLVAIPVMVLAGFITFAALRGDTDAVTPIDGYAAASASAVGA